MIMKRYCEGEPMRVIRELVIRVHVKSAELLDSFCSELRSGGVKAGLRSMAGSAVGRRQGQFQKADRCFNGGGFLKGGAA